MIIKQRHLYITQSAVNDGSFAFALHVFAEWQHDILAPHHFINDDADVRAEFNLIRNALLPAERTAFIEGAVHGE